MVHTTNLFAFGNERGLAFLRQCRLCNLPLWQLRQEDHQSQSETHSEGVGDQQFWESLSWSRGRPCAEGHPSLTDLLSKGSPALEGAGPTCDSSRLWYHHLDSLSPGVHLNAPHVSVQAVPEGHPSSLLVPMKTQRPCSIRKEPGSNTT